MKVLLFWVAVVAIFGTALYNDYTRDVACAGAGGDKVLNGTCYKLVPVDMDDK